MVDGSARFSNSDQIEEIKLVVLGDGNGRRGLVRRMDAVEGKLAVIVRLCWIIVGTAVATFVTILITAIVSR